MYSLKLLSKQLMPSSISCKMIMPYPLINSLALWPASSGEGEGLGLAEDGKGP